ncbi:MAG: hypothetical protein ACTS22_05640 [Phycisphaerales bacterium]
MQLRLDDEAQAIVAREGGPLSVRVLDELGVWMRGTGWAREVRRVARTRSGAISIEVSWHQPAAVVRQGAREHVLSADGRRLPLAWPAGTSAMPAITGAEHATPAADVPAGDRWPDAEVQAGVDLLTVLHRELGDDENIGPRGFDQVRAIDVSKYRTLQQLVILTDRDTRIVWGRAPGDPVQDIVSTAQKLSRLANLRNHPDYGRRIDAGMAYLDLSSGPILVDQRAPGDAAAGR